MAAYRSGTSGRIAVLARGLSRRVRLPLVVAAVVAVAAFLPVPSASAATLTISGYVYRDANDNGVRDPGEAGVAGIRVRHGSGSVSTVTSADGGYTLTGLPASGNVTVETGWLRSQCPDASKPTSITCAAGPGADNDFTVNNQFLRYPLSGASSASNVDVGLLPDWPGDSLLPPAGTVPANPVDVSARLSWVTSTCTDGAYTICRAGDTFTLNAQVFNQGTTALTGIVAKLLVPAGDCLTGVALTSSATAPGVTGLSTSPSTFGCATRLVTITLPGSLVAAGAVLIAVKGSTLAGPGTPGCVPGSPVAATCTQAEPEARGWLFAVSHIDQTGDPDSDFCAAGDPATCPTGLHDKRRNPDEVDPVGHNVAASLGGTTAIDVQTFVTSQSPAGVPHAGGSVALRVWAANQLDGQPANQVNPGTTVSLYLPVGTAVSLPPKHALLACTSAAKTTAVVVTCTYKGPLSPALSAVAINVTVTIPANWPVGSTFHLVACGAPPAGQASAERVPAATCDLGSDPGSTSTNNDAALDLVVS
jgi:hypothetical protein